MNAGAPLLSRSSGVSQSSTAAATRSSQPFGVNFIPPRWPFAVALVFIVAGIAGSIGAWLTSPVGNRVALTVRTDGADDASLAARHAVEHELTRQLRSLKLDVGGPPDGAGPPAVLLDAVVSLVTPDDLAFAAAVEITADVRVVDDDAGGEAVQRFIGFGATPTQSAVTAAAGATVLLVGDLAALIAPQHARETVLRRVTDGRASLRVFARRWAELVYGRQERLNRVHLARMASETASVAYSTPSESVRLLAALSDTTVLAAVENRIPTLVPTTREEPGFLAGPERLELRSSTSKRALLTAPAFLGRAAVSAGFVVFAMRDGDGGASACILALQNLEQPTCLPLGAVADATVDSVTDDGSAVHLTTWDCLSGCAPRGQLWGVAEQDLITTPAVTTPEPPGHWAGDILETHWLDEETALVLTEGGTMVHRGRLQRVHKDTTTVVNLTSGVGDERHAALTPGKTAVFYEVSHPDPDASGTWTEIRRLVLP